MALSICDAESSAYLNDRQIEALTFKSDYLWLRFTVRADVLYPAAVICSFSETCTVLAVVPIPTTRDWSFPTIGLRRTLESKRKSLFLGSAI